MTKTRSALAGRAAAFAATFALAAFGAFSTSASAAAEDVKLSGDQEVPPVSTAAVGQGKIVVAADGAVSGSITTQGLTGTMAHVHIGPTGKNGPVIVALSASANGVWLVPPGAKLTPEQLTAYKAGELYVNVHSDAHKGGEIRAQLKP